MKPSLIASVAFIAGVALTVGWGVRARHTMIAAATAPPPQATAAAAPGEGDRESVLKTARAFEEAYNAGDAKKIATLFTENAESRNAAGRTLTGRSAIEKAFAEFFKANKGVKIEVLVRSIRFPATDMAIEEGLLRQSRGPRDLPSTTAYVAIHSREGGKWKIALSSEGGHGQNRLEDLDWLLGEWTTKVKDATVTFRFVRDPKKAVIHATFSRTPNDKEPISGSIRIALDPETGQIRSWGFEDDGAHSQELWACDGKGWIIDTRGVLGDGTPTAERLILQRVTPDVITWRAVDRILGDEALPDTPPLRLTRVKQPK